MDSRRRRYVPLSITFASSSTGTSIRKRYGLEGLCVWTCLLAACKRANVQGTFEWYSDGDAWTRLGIGSTPPAGFTFTEFAAFLGRLHLTKTERRGELRTTLVRGWNEWNTTISRAQDAEKKSRKRAQNTGDKTTTLGGTEVEGEGETPLPPIRRKIKSPENRNGAGYTCPKCGAVQRNASELEDHLEYVHPQPVTVPTSSPDDDLPL